MPSSSAWRKPAAHKPSSASGKAWRCSSHSCINTLTAGQVATGGGPVVCAAPSGASGRQLTLKGGHSILPRPLCVGSVWRLLPPQRQVSALQLLQPVAAMHGAAHRACMPAAQAHLLTRLDSRHQSCQLQQPRGGSACMQQCRCQYTNHRCAERKQARAPYLMRCFPVPGCRLPRQPQTPAWPGCCA